MRDMGLYDPKFEHDSCGVGFVCDIKGKKSSDIVGKGLEVLNRLAHRGATGSDPRTGDGAGILIQTPHKLFVKVCGKEGIVLPEEGCYASGMVFLPQDEHQRKFCKKIFSFFIKQEKQDLLGWRKVPVDGLVIGHKARDTQPAIEQVFIKRCPSVKDTDSFERKLYIIRKQIENAVSRSDITQKSFFYITNLSSRTFSYKGLLTPPQLRGFFRDLGDNDIESALCIVHSRYSTNTFPTWDLSQPFRFLAHNGEINTLRGNINWMKAKEGLLSADCFGNDIEKIKHIIVPKGSDSASLDNVFELLFLSGRGLAHSMMMLIPSAWERDDLMDENLKSFYKYHACLMEPWDGPAAIAFTDGIRIGAVLDRNGLRPARYIVTKKDMVVMASEAGVLDINPEEISCSGRLEPGKMLFIDTETGGIVEDGEIKKQVSLRRPYKEWIDENLLKLEDLPDPGNQTGKIDDYHRILKAFGYTREDLKFLMKPMAENGEEPIGSMGSDTPHAVLSKNPQLLYNYFKQLFAQVTNPPIDPIREELVMSLECYMGTRKNLLDETPLHCAKLWLEHPILTNKDLARIKNMKGKSLHSKTVSILFNAGEIGNFHKAVERICAESLAAVKEGYNFIVLSDRIASREYAALPALLAVGAVHQTLVDNGCRSQIALILESAEPREVHHFALLFGYGAGCVNPYLSFEVIEKLYEEGEITVKADEAKSNYVKAINKGILKILSKMGISTLRSYRGAQIFEALGLADDVIEKCFSGTVSRIGGATFDVIAEETIRRHRSAYISSEDGCMLSAGGVYQWKKDGEFHMWNPDTISALQDAARLENYDRYKEFSSMVNDQSENPVTLRALLDLTGRNPIPLIEVEKPEHILKRFVTGAMSFGSISRSAHESLALAMNRIGGKSNTGEGGEDPSRFISLHSGHSKRSAIKQVASGRFGVTTNYLVNADELQIKIAQGAKPGEGGQLPGHKVSVVIASTRYTTPGVTLISPPPHHDIYSIEDLAQLIFDLKNVNPYARISVKLVSEIGVGTVAAGVAKGHADMILISGGDGGTGASPLSSIKHAGLPWELGVSETHQTLVMNDLRSRVRLQTDGQMRTGRDVAIAALLGAEEFGFCTACLIVLGCVMLRHCHLNNCSVGVATQDELLQKNFRGRFEYVVTYIHFIVRELREIMASLGIRTMDEMVGRTELLKLNREIVPWKAGAIDYSRMLYKPEVPGGAIMHCTEKQEHGIEDVLDKKLIRRCKRSLIDRNPVKDSFEIKNTDRAVGAMLSGQVCKIYGNNGLPEDTIHLNFSGVAGQSFGAWLAGGITLELEGMCNDYVGKGLSGGKIIIYPGKRSEYNPSDNIIIGNTAFYGAISGEAYIRGIAGERFCVRNSGINAVVEGVGDHGCEYMTGGRVVVLGKTGRNFAAGMSGGIAYVYDRENLLKNRCNLKMVSLEECAEEDKTLIYKLVHNHFRFTGSGAAAEIIENSGRNMGYFIKVIPLEYKKILESRDIEEKLGLAEISDG
ncbi:MAG: glutamate synthase large subunit [bacterium]|nr:glutamate synthase large subunit [bacterium]